AQCPTPRQASSLRARPPTRHGWRWSWTAPAGDEASTPSPGFAGYSPDFAGRLRVGRDCSVCFVHPPSPGFAGDSPDFAGERLLCPSPSPGFAGYSPDFAGERLLRLLRPSPLPRLRRVLPRLRGGESG